MSALDVDEMRGRWRPGQVAAAIAHEEVTTFAELYEIACEDVAALLDELDRLRAEREGLRTLAQVVATQYATNTRAEGAIACRWCGVWLRSDRPAADAPHTAGCIVRLARDLLDTKK